jgi:hypothetical protein
MLDIFRGDAFGVVPLSLAINNLKFVPGFVSSRGIFSEIAIATTAVAIEEHNNILTLVAPSPRGGPGHTMPKPRRTMRMLGVPHFEINDAIMAEEVQGVRPFGQETGTDAVMTKVGERNQIAGQSRAYTQEHARSAIKGRTYADGRNGRAVWPPADQLPFSTNPGRHDPQDHQQVIRTMGNNLDGLGVRASRRRLAAPPTR